MGIRGGPAACGKRCCSTGTSLESSPGRFTAGCCCWKSGGITVVMPVVGEGSTCAGRAGRVSGGARSGGAAQRRARVRHTALRPLPAPPGPHLQHGHEQRAVGGHGVAARVVDRQRRPRRARLLVRALHGAAPARPLPRAAPLAAAAWVSCSHGAGGNLCGGVQTGGAGRSRLWGLAGGRGCHGCGARACPSACLPLVTRCQITSYCACPDRPVPMRTNPPATLRCRLHAMEPS